MEKKRVSADRGRGYTSILVCKHYRGIKLLSHTLKLIEKSDEQRLTECTSIQERFIPSRSTTDPIFGLEQIVEKLREGQKDINVLFIDLETAYDRIPREEMWRCARELHVPEKYTIVMHDMHR